MSDYSGKQKQFVGFTKVVETKFGKMFKLGLKQDNLDLLKQNIGDGGWVNVIVTESKDGKGMAYIDDWKPTAKKNDLDF
jgi:hypothetical protein